tara:strand:- start:308 stop:547 length:240 start_codon:yes stop_codon:yes gene_type:complete
MAETPAHEDGERFGTESEFVIPADTPVEDVIAAYEKFLVYVWFASLYALLESIILISSIPQQSDQPPSRIPVQPQLRSL